MAEFQQGLLITAIGMGLVFAVITFLWGLMALMMRLTSNGSKLEVQAEEEKMTGSSRVPEIEMTEKQKRAAAAAVAVGIAMSGSRFKSEEIKEDDKKGRLSPWQAFHRLRQLEKRRR